MKKWCAPLLAALPLFILAPSRGMALNQEPDARNEISVDLAMPVVINVANPDNHAIPIVLEYQLVLTDHLVLSIAPGIAYIQQIRWSALMMELWVGLNWHPFQEGLRGFYVGPGVAVFGVLDTTVSTLGVFLGVTVGYQFVLAAHISVDLALGLAVGPVHDPNTSSVRLGGLPRAALAIGYRF